MTLEAEYGKDAKVACIGPAAEKLSLISAIITDHGSAAARSGLGAVMGSKKLKAVVCRGKPELAVANKEALMALRKEHLDHYNKPGRDGKPWLQGQHYYGTSSITYFGAHSGDSPVKNWGGVGVVDVPDKEPFNPDNVAKDVDKRVGAGIVRWRARPHLKRVPANISTKLEPDDRNMKPRRLSGSVVPITTFKPSIWPTISATATVWIRFQPARLLLSPWNAMKTESLLKRIPVA
jgi:hypothetical protein